MGNVKAIVFEWGDTVMRVFHEEKGPMYLWKDVEWIPSMERALKMICHRFVCCIATGAKDSDTKMMIKALARINADEYFHAFYSEKDLKVDKADPDFFEIVRNKIKVRADEIIVVSSDYSVDIVGAKHNNMKTIYFNEKEIPGEYPDADHVITKMNQLVVMVEALDSGYRD